MVFTEEKFKSLSKKSQHKKLAELLKKFYFERDPKIFGQIKNLEVWMQCSWTSTENPETISNSFHRHLKETGLGISEHNLLIKEQDREKPLKECKNSVIYLDHLRSAHNIGNIVRTVEAFRLGAICFSPDMPDLTHRAVQKTSMGAHLLVETREANLQELPKPLIIIETHQNAIPLDQFTFPETFTLVLGNEEYGVSRDILEQADHIVEVALVGCKNSLNVAACFSILAWKIRN